MNIMFDTIAWYRDIVEGAQGPTTHPRIGPRSC